MTTATIIAFLAFLSAFNVPVPTIQNVSDILYATQASTTQVTAVTTLQATPTGDTTLTVQNSPQTPSFGATIIPMDKSAITVEQEGTVFKVRVLDADGNATKMAPVHMSTATTQKDAQTDTVTGQTSIGATRITDDWYAGFTYKGAGTITFTSGNLTKSITIGN